MEDLAVFTALNHSGSFGKNFAKLEIINIDTCAFTSASNITFVASVNVPDF